MFLLPLDSLGGSKLGPGSWVQEVGFRAVCGTGQGLAAQGGLAARGPWLPGGLRQESQLQHSEQFRVLSDSVTGTHRARCRRKVKRQREPNKRKNSRCYKK